MVLPGSPLPSSSAILLTRPRYPNGKVACPRFPCKINPRGTRIMIVVRCRFADGKYLPTLVTCRPDGSELRTVVPHRLWNWGQSPISEPNKADSHRKCKGTDKEEDIGIELR